MLVWLGHFSTTQQKNVSYVITVITRSYLGSITVIHVVKGKQPNLKDPVMKLSVLVRFAKHMCYQTQLQL